MKKDIVAGLGEIGLPILKLLSKKHDVVGFDTDKKLMNSITVSYTHLTLPTKA